MLFRRLWRRLGLGIAGALFAFGVVLPGDALAQGFGCQVGLRQQPRLWIYTDSAAGSSRLKLVRVSEALGELLGEVPPPKGRKAYSIEVIRNNDARRLIDQLDLLSCVSGKILNVDLTSRKILRDPEQPFSQTLLFLTFTLQDHSKLEDSQRLELGSFRLLLTDPENPKALKTALSPLLEQGLADCVFKGAARCEASAGR